MSEESQQASEQTPEQADTAAIGLGKEKWAERTHDTLKHLTTLSAGSILLIGTFSSIIFPTNERGTLEVGLASKWLIGLSIVLFGLSLIWAVIALYSLSLMAANWAWQMNWLNMVLNALSRVLGSENRIEVFGSDTPAITRGELIVVLLPFIIFVLGLFLFGTAVLVNLL